MSNCLPFWSFWFRSPRVHAPPPKEEEFSSKHHREFPSPPLVSSLDTLPEYKNIPKYIPLITKGKVIKVYDGDTITVAACLPNSTTLYRFSIRLRGIDCPEINTTHPDEHKIALLAKQFVINHTLSHMVYFTQVDLDKYGRILANVYLTSECTSPSLSELLLLEHLAVPYNGKTKHSPNNWVEYHQS